MEDTANPFTSGAIRIWSRRVPACYNLKAGLSHPLSRNRISLDFSSMWAQRSRCALKGYVPSYRR